MRPLMLSVLPLALATLAACGSEAEPQPGATDQTEQASATPAAGGGGALTALGLTEAQMLDADLVTSDGTDLGDVEELRYNADGGVDGVLVALDDTNPQRYVMVPTPVLTTRQDGDDIDLQTLMSAADLAAMPDANPPAS